MGTSTSIISIVNVVAMLVHLWGGCCAHLNHACADHQHDELATHQHTHGHTSAIDHHPCEAPSDSTNPEEQPLDLCEHGGCDFNVSATVQVPAPELSLLSGLIEIQLVTHSSLETSLSLLRPSRFSNASGARLHQPLQIWLI
ncbi:hypothetical protein Pla110_03290 [Polystyrenella longa]|uniref:Uncharacterized protein n=1 Tax=Polystyrenella longa TaxID=2528007 RepID=A0A518CHB9_9PLAN|nr:hypothetical protein [Polystyrenella longa]QDU78625.1 hypothetical protein Pla110_03290 [Polystyrenella longa]